MNFFVFLKSLTELLYEIISWMVFYPVTLWRTVRHPLAMMDYAEGQLADGVTSPYDDALSPPVFLLLTVILAHSIELAAIGESRLIADTNGLAAVISDNVSLILMRLLAFAAFPVIVAAYSVRRRRVVLTRTALTEPFFAQCYGTAPLSLAFSVAVTLAQVDRFWAGPVAVAIVVMATGGWLTLEARWLAMKLQTGVWTGFRHALWTYLQAWAMLIPLAWLMVGQNF